MKSFFCNAIPKTLKIKVFSSHLKSHQGEGWESCQNERIFPRLKQASILRIFQGFLNKWMYTLKCHRFLTADCCSRLHQLQSFYHGLKTLWPGLVTRGWLVAFFSCFPMQVFTSSSESWSLGFTLRILSNLSKIASTRHCWQIASI